jgi:hypothetical protein
MAPEVGLDMGYGLPADVYSFSILLWEIFALKKPFAKIKCAAEFNTAVFQKGERPKVGKNWPEELKGVLEDGWSIHSTQRPTMKDYQKILGTLQRQVSLHRPDNSHKLRASLLGKMDSFRRLSG